MTLPEPDFIARDPIVIEQEMFADYTTISGGLIAEPGSPEDIFLKMMAYREVLIRVGINEAAKQNLACFARFPMLDYIGELVGVSRLDAQQARTTMQITLPAPHGEPITIVAGTRRRSRDGRFVFATASDVTIPAGDLSAQVLALSETAGVGANGYAVGQIDVEVDPLPNSATMHNVTQSANGALRETDERMLDRILLAPSSFSTAGPEEAYRYHALTASAAVRDVQIDSVEPGLLVCYVLAQDGVPGSEVLAAVEEKLSDEKIRPMSDTVNVEACSVVTWSIEVELRLYKDVDSEATLAAAIAGAESYRDARQRGLGRDLVPSQLKRACGVRGVYDLEVVAPSALVSVASNEWANCTGISVSVVEVVDEALGSEAL